MSDMVNHPSHYTDGKYEVIDFIEDKRFDYRLGNAVKYISRAGKKDPAKEAEDIQKAIWYIKRRMDNVYKKDFMMDRTRKGLIDVDSYIRDKKLNDYLGRALSCLCDVYTAFDADDEFNILNAAVTSLNLYLDKLV